MKLRTIAAALLCCTVLSGCAPMQQNVENLMQPPKLTDLQFQVDAALREAVGKSFSLKYPRNGSYKSAFNFIDLSGDKVDEAIAFFVTSEDNLQMAVLTQTDGGWMVSDTLPGLASEVDFVAFEPVGGGKRLMVGWGGASRENNLMTVYNYGPGDSGQPTLTPDSRWDYSRVTVTDIDRDGRNELLLLVAADSYSLSAPLAQLVGETAPGTVDLLAETELPQNIAAFYPPVMGGVGNSQYGATVDCVLNNDSLCTITLAYVNGVLTLPLNSMDRELFRRTIRTQPVLSCDVNGDGTTDIPLERPAKGYETAATADIIYFTDYSNVMAEGLAAVQTAYVNQSKGYRLLFPDSWAQQPVSAFLQPDGGEVLLFLNESDNLYDHSQELVRIKVYSTQDEQDVLDGSRYFQLAAKGSYIYCAALPDEPVPELSLTKKQLLELFSLTTG